MNLIIEKCRRVAGFTHGLLSNPVPGLQALVPDLDKLKGMVKSIWQWLDKSLFTKQTGKIITNLIDALQGLIVWALEVVCVLGAIVLVWHAVGSLISAELMDGMVLAFCAAWLLLVCMLSDNYRRGQPRTGGVKIPRD